MFARGSRICAGAAGLPPWEMASHMWFERRRSIAARSHDRVGEPNLRSPPCSGPGGGVVLTVQWISVVSLLLVLVLVGWRMRGRTMLMATCFGLAFAVLVLWLDQSGLWPQSWHR